MAIVGVFDPGGKYAGGKGLGTLLSAAGDYTITDGGGSPKKRTTTTGGGIGGAQGLTYTPGSGGGLSSNPSGNGGLNFTPATPAAITPASPASAPMSAMAQPAMPSPPRGTPASGQSFDMPSPGYSAKAPQTGTPRWRSAMASALSR